MMFNNIDLEDSNSHGTQVLALCVHNAETIIAVKVLISNGSRWYVVIGTAQPQSLFLFQALSTHHGYSLSSLLVNGPGWWLCSFLGCQLGVAVDYYRATPLPLCCMGYVDHVSESMHECLYAFGKHIFHSR
jgi:hypothetical protein